MSTSRTVSYKCPYCGRIFDVEVWDAVTADTDQDLRDRCLSGDLFKVLCPHCQKDFMIQYPLVYIDEAHRFILWLSAKEVPQSLLRSASPFLAKGYKLRRCAALSEFCEKIQIFEDGMDDVMAELAKYDCFIEFIDNKKGRPEDVTSVEYQRTENDVMKITVRTGDKGMSFMIPTAMLEEEMAADPEKYRPDTEVFPLINADWILSLFMKTDGTA